MQHAAQAYKKVANETSTTRELEANLLLKSAARIQSIRDGWDGRKTELSDALMFNRKLWTIFLSEAMRENNPQPLDVRQKIANISVFVLSQTAALQMSPQFDHFRPLIEINRNIAAGLSGRP
jgi:flagellar biosynthesis activator protein FlaF